MPTTLATAGDLRIEADNGLVYFSGDRRACSFAQFLAAVTKHGWTPEVTIEKAREIFPNQDEGFGLDEPPEQGADDPTIHPDSVLARLARRKA